MEIERQVEYWRTGSAEDFAVPESLAAQHPRHALFLAHLSLEKLLEAHVVRATGQTPPRIHDLLRLAELARLEAPPARSEFLAAFQRHCLAGRYPDYGRGEPDPAETGAELAAGREVLAWLRTALEPTA